MKGEPMMEQVILTIIIGAIVVGAAWCSWTLDER